MHGERVKILKFTLKLILKLLLPESRSAQHTAHSTQHTLTIPGHNMLSHHRITHNDVILQIVLT
jgi:hypothetical protein